MRLRDRRGPLTALVLAIAYFLVMLASIAIFLIPWFGADGLVQDSFPIALLDP